MSRKLSDKDLDKFDDEEKKFADVLFGEKLTKTGTKVPSPLLGPEDSEGGRGRHCPALERIQKMLGSEYRIVELDPTNPEDAMAIDRLGGMPDENGKRRNEQQRLYTFKEINEFAGYQFKQNLPFLEVGQCGAVPAP